MGRAVQLLLLCLLSFAFSCGDGRTLDNTNERVGISTSKLVAPNSLTYPVASMTSWADGSYGACGSGNYITGQCHIGNDLMAAAGTPVYPITSGTVIWVSNKQDTDNDCYKSGWGYDYYKAQYNPNGTNTCNMGLLVQHLDASGQPFISLYGHLRNNPNIQRWDPVPAGQPIGVIGGYYHTS